MGGQLEAAPLGTDIAPVHYPAMRRAGLDPDKPYDLARYAVTMWERSGWGPWSCKP